MKNKKDELNKLKKKTKKYFIFQTNNMESN